MIQTDCQGGFKGNTSTQSSKQARDVNVVFLRPIADTLRLAEGSQMSRGASISRLNVSRLPRAIRGIVRAVVITSIKGMRHGRLEAHVGEEIGERVTPTIADINPSTSIMGIFLRLGVVAAILHSVPRSIFCAARQVVRAFERTHTFASKTATGMRRSSKFASDHGFLCAAIALHGQSSGMPALAGKFTNYQKMTHAIAKMMHPLSVACFDVFSVGNRHILAS